MNQKKKNQKEEITQEVKDLVRAIKTGFEGVRDECIRKEQRIEALEAEVISLKEAIYRQADILQELTNDGR